MEENDGHPKSDLPGKTESLPDPFFKTYDCRGRYGTEATEEKTFWLGKACNAYKRPLVVGMDYREHNDSLASAFLQGFEGPLRFGGNLPSPAVAYASKAGWGVSFTASHNPAGYSGVKFKKHQRCFFENELSALKGWYDFSKKTPFVSKEDPLPFVDEQVRADYENALLSFEDGIYDLAGGAACALKDVFPDRLFDEPDPVFSKRGPEPTQSTLSALASTTKKQRKVGFAFDGDADRCVAVDQGLVVDGGLLTAFIATRHFPKKTKVLVTLDTQDEVFRYLQDEGFSVDYTPVGDVYLVRKMLETGADFAAERSGHYSFKKHMPDSDGIFTASLLSPTKPGELADFCRKFKNVSLISEVRFEVDFGKLKSLVDKSATRVDGIDGVKAQFETFTFLARASKTEEKVRLNVEARTASAAKEGMEKAMAWLQDCRRSSATA